MDTVIVHPDGRQALWLVEEVAVLLQEVGQEGMLGVSVGRGELELRCRGGASNALPPDAAALAPEGHRQGVEVPKDGAEGPQEVDAEDEVEAAQVDAGACDGEVLVADGERHVLRQSMAPKAVAVGHRDSEMISARWLEG